MSTTSVYSIRIDSQVRKLIDDVNDPAFQEEVRMMIEQLARQKRKAELLRRARQIQMTVKEGPSAANIIREDRDAQ